MSLRNYVHDAAEAGTLKYGDAYENQNRTSHAYRRGQPSCAGSTLGFTGMSLFKVNIVARNPKHEEMATQPLEALVDTGSELTWLPADILKSAGIVSRRKRMFAAATQQKIERDVGYAILSAEGCETNDEVVFAEPGDMTLLGVRTLEGFGVMVDNIGHRFVATTAIVATAVSSDSINS